MVLFMLKNPHDLWVSCMMGPSRVASGWRSGGPLFMFPVIPPPCYFILSEFQISLLGLLLDSLCGSLFDEKRKRVGCGLNLWHL